MRPRLCLSLLCPTLSFPAISFVYLCALVHFPPPICCLLPFFIDRLFELALLLLFFCRFSLLKTFFAVRPQAFFLLLLMSCRSRFDHCYPDLLRFFRLFQVGLSRWFFSRMCPHTQFCLSATHWTPIMFVHWLIQRFPAFPTQIHPTFSSLFLLRRSNTTPPSRLAVFP